MIVKFHNRGKGSGRGPVEYLLGRDYNRDAAKLLRGDPQQTIDLINATQFAKRYTSGVLSFEESDIPDHLKQTLMNDFERMLLPGLDPNQYDILWVEHRDKGRLELNYVIPNVELTTGKRLQPYYHAADFRRVAAWQDVANAEHGFSDPNDPAKRRSLILPADAFADRKNALQAITEGLTRQIELGAVRNRENVIQALSEAGFNVVRETKQSISIADPSGGKNLRLKGAIYERHFEFSGKVRESIERASEQFKQSASERLEASRRSLETGINLKREANRERYATNRVAASGAVGEHESIAISSSQPLDDLGSHRQSGDHGSSRGVLAVDAAEPVGRTENGSLAESVKSRHRNNGAGRTIHPTDPAEPVRDRSTERRNDGNFYWGAVDYDRTRTGFIERVKGAVRTAQHAAASFINNAKGIIGRIRESFSGEQGYQKPDNKLRYAGRQLASGNHELEATGELYRKLAKRLESRLNNQSPDDHTPQGLRR